MGKLGALLCSCLYTNLCSGYWQHKQQYLQGSSPCSPTCTALQLGSPWSRRARGHAPPTHHVAPSAHFLSHMPSMARRPFFPLDKSACSHRANIQSPPNFPWLKSLCIYCQSGLSALLDLLVCTALCHDDLTLEQRNCF